MSHNQQIFRYSRRHRKYLAFCFSTITVGCVVWIFWIINALTKTPKPIPPEGVLLSLLIIGIPALVGIFSARQFVDARRHRIEISNDHVEIIGIKHEIFPRNSIMGYRIRGNGAESEAFLFLISKQSKKKNVFIGLRCYENPKDILAWTKENFTDLDAVDLESGVPLGPGWRK